MQMRCTSALGVRASLEKFRLPSFGSGMEEERNEWIGQYSLFYENQLRLTSRFFLRIGINGVGYDPRNSKNYFSIQPRLSLKYTLGEKDLIYADFSRMEQFYHTVRLDNTALRPISVCQVLTGIGPVLPNTMRWAGSIWERVGNWNVLCTTRPGGMWWH